MTATSAYPGERRQVQPTGMEPVGCVLVESQGVDPKLPEQQAAHLVLVSVWAAHLVTPPRIGCGGELVQRAAQDIHLPVQWSARTSTGSVSRRATGSSPSSDSSNAGSVSVTALRSSARRPR